MWRFPKQLPNTNETISPEDLEGALGPFRSLPGHLGEHHWNTTISSELVRKTDLAVDVAYRFVNAKRSTTGLKDFMSDGKDSSTQRVQRVAEWIPIDDTSHTFRTEGGLFMIWTSGMYWTSATSLNSNQLKFGVLLNGGLYTDLCVGGLDEIEEGIAMEQGLMGDRGSWTAEGVIPLPPGTHTLQAAVKAQTSPDIYEANGSSVANASIGYAEMFVLEIIA